MYSVIPLNASNPDLFPQHPFILSIADEVEGEELVDLVEGNLSFVTADGDDESGQAPLSPASVGRGRSKRSQDVNLSGALKRLSDHVGQRRTEKMAVSFTKVSFLPLRPPSLSFPFVLSYSDVSYRIVLYRIVLPCIVPFCNAS